MEEEILEMRHVTEGSRRKLLKRNAYGNGLDRSCWRQCAKVSELLHTEAGGNICEGTSGKSTSAAM